MDPPYRDFLRFYTKIHSIRYEKKRGSQIAFMRLPRALYGAQFMPVLKSMTYFGINSI